MTEQTALRPASEQAAGGPDDLNDVFGDNQGLPGMVEVGTGVHSVSMPLAGMTVGEIRRRLSDHLDIDPDAVAVLGTTSIDDDSTTVRAGQRLTFVRDAGEKGHHRCRTTE